MFIETWMLAFFVLVICGIALVALFGWINEGKKLEMSNRENDELQKENAELKRYIAVQNTKKIIGIANDYYNEGKKK